ncbi:MAG: helix-turn-helix domain-containing protein, partial [Planctomycetota bacterium]
ASKALLEYPFPDNIRELENILERATALCENNLITVKDLQLPETEPLIGEDPPNNGVATLSIEKDEIIKALQQHRWNQSATARSLGITLRQLRYKMEKLELNKT